MGRGMDDHALKVTGSVPLKVNVPVSVSASTSVNRNLAAMASTMTIGPSCRILTFVVNSARATRLPFAVHFPYLYVPVTPSALTTIWPHLPSLNFPPYVWGTRASAKAGAADIMRAAAAAMSDVRMCHFLSAVLPKKCRAEECDSV